MAERFEFPLSGLYANGFQALASYAKENGPWLLFTWLALIFLKTHLKDRHYRWHLDARKGTQAIGDDYVWEYLHHIHCVVRTFFSGCALDKEVMGSVLLLPASTNEQLRFDYADLYEAQTILLRIDAIAVIAVLNDSCATLQPIRGILQPIAGPLSALQLREVMAHMAFINLNLQDRPEFSTSISLANETCRISGKHAERVQLRELRQDDFGALMYKNCGPVIEALNPPNRDEILEGLREGRWTFLTGRDGDFIQDQLATPPASH